VVNKRRLLFVYCHRNNSLLGTNWRKAGIIGSPLPNSGTSRLLLLNDKISAGHSLSADV
jgi:hypothetical protein